MTPTDSNPSSGGRRQATSARRKRTSITGGCAKYVGRIGALAVALGVGAAAANSPGIALADPSGSGSSTRSSTASSSRSDSSSTSSTTAQRSQKGFFGGVGDSQTRTTRPGHTAAVSGSSATGGSTVTTTSALAGDQSPGADSTAGRLDRGVFIPSGNAKSAADSASGAKRHQPAVTDQAVSGLTSTVSTPRNEVRRQASQPVTEVTTAADSAANLGNVSSAQGMSPAVVSPTAQAAVMNAAAAVSTNAAAAQAIPAAAASGPVTPVGVVFRLVSVLMSVVRLDTRATNNPVVPPQSVALLAMLTWVRRETQSTFRANDPAIADDPASSGQTIDGAASRGLNATQSLVDTAASSTTTSPLGTADQLAAEKQATQIVNTLAVRLATIVLEAGWFLEAEQNFAVVGGPDQANFAQLDEAASQYAMQSAMEVQLLDPNSPEVLQEVMPPHTWYGQTVGGSRIFTTTRTRSIASSRSTALRLM